MNRTEFVMKFGFTAGVIFMLLMIVLHYAGVINDLGVAVFGACASAEFILTALYVYVDYFEAVSKVMKEEGR